MVKTYRMMMNQCPWCGVAIALENVCNVNPKASPDDCHIGPCTVCGHLVALWFAPGGFETSQFGYDWLHTHILDKDRAILHNIQERYHHERGHWG